MKNNPSIKGPAKVLGLLIILAAYFISIIACEKENGIHSPDDAMRIKPRTVVDPVLNSGYLLFDDRAHLANFYYYLETVADTATDLMGSLYTIAARLGHNSLLYSDSAAFANPRDIALTDASVCDPLRKLVLNSKYEVGIGDSLFILQNRWETYSFPLGDTEMRGTLNSTPKGTRVDASLITPSTRLVDSDNTILTNRTTICFQFNRIRRGNPCENELDVSVFAGAAVLGFGSSFDIDIDWGDGNSTIENTVTGSDIWTHTYSTPGTYTVVSNLYTSCAGPITLTSAAIVRVGGICDFNNQHEDEWDDEDDIGMSSEIWFQRDVFGSHSGAKTICFEFINGKWRQRKGEVSVYIESNFRESQCDIEDTDDEIDDCGNCQSKTARVISSEVNHYHLTGDVNSEHSVVRGGVTLNRNIELQFTCE